MGRQIVAYRESMVISQEMLAELAGLDTRQIGRIERVENNSSISLIKKLADSLKIKISGLLDA